MRGSATSPQDFRCFAQNDNDLYGYGGLHGRIQKGSKKLPFQGGLAFRSVFPAGAYIINPNLKTVTVLTVFESHKQLHI